jgi:hypothetical protein
MELQQFITDALVEIVEGVKNAQKNLQGNGEINPSPIGSASSFESKSSFITHGRKIGTFVDFDIAVTATEGTGTKGGIGVFVGSIGLGSQGQSTESNSTVSRIRFQVPITFS